MSRPPVNVLAAFDDAGLSLSAYRVGCRIARRWTEDRGCYESASNMAEACRIKRDTVFKALLELEARGMITRSPQDGKTTRIDFTDAEKWTGTRPPKRDTPNKGASPQTGRVPVPPNGTPPVPPNGTLRELRKGTKEGNYLEARAPSAAPPFQNGPTLKEVQDVAAMSGVKAKDAEAFFYHYEAQDWHTSGKHSPRIRNWQAKLKGWSLRQADYQNGTKTHSAPTGEIPFLRAPGT